MGEAVAHMMTIARIEVAHNCRSERWTRRPTSGTMRSVPDIIASDEFESPALFWMYREIKRLDEVMQSVGLADQAARREIARTSSLVRKTVSPSQSQRSTRSIRSQTRPHRGRRPSSTGDGQLRLSRVRARHRPRVLRAPASGVAANRPCITADTRHRQWCCGHDTSTSALSCSSNAIVRSDGTLDGDSVEAVPRSSSGRQPISVPSGRWVCQWPCGSRQVW